MAAAAALISSLSTSTPHGSSSSISSTNFTHGRSSGNSKLRRKKLLLLLLNNQSTLAAAAAMPTNNNNNNRTSKRSSFSAPPPHLVCRSSLAPPPQQIHQEEDDDDDDDGQKRRKVPDVQTLLRRFWKVAAPYWSSDDKIQARWHVAALFALTLGTTGISVGFNYLGRDFYNSLANKDQDQFSKQLLYYLASFAGGIPVFVLRDYAKDTLSLRWRSWMTSYYMDRYLNNQTFYKIQSQSIIDNPDQRIVDDLSSFTATSLAFSLTFFNAAVDLISFSNILYGIYPPLFLVLLAYSLGGTAISIYLGRGLVPLNFLQEKKEADFRYGLVRVRENAESIAFYGGEQNEMQLLVERFRSAFDNLSKLLISSRNLEFFTSGYRYLIQILPAAVVAPMYFSGKIDFGVINQSSSAFNHILGDFSLIVYQIQALSAFSAVIDRLGEFDDLLTSSETRSDSESIEEISREFYTINNSITSNGSLSLGGGSKLLQLEHLTLLTPSKATLINDLSLEICEKDHLLIAGPSGSGKTSLLRTIAGLWSFGTGTITFYENRNAGVDPSPSVSADVASLEATSVDEPKHDKHEKKNSRNVFFLPQKPYMVLGTLRQQLLYPTWNDDQLPIQNTDKPTGSTKDTEAKLMKPTTDDLIRVMEDVRLGYILSRFDLDSTYEWSSVLSVGEQQRLAFARLLLSNPNLVLLDESTSALDEANEVIEMGAFCCPTLFECAYLLLNYFTTLSLKRFRGLLAHLYQLIGSAGITYVSIGHRRTLYEHHKSVLHITPLEPTSFSTNWCLEHINKDTLYNLSKQ